MIRFGVFILLVFVGTELSAFSHFQQVPDQNGGGSSPSDDSSAAKEAKAKFEQSLNACEGDLSAENYQSVLGAFESLDAEAKKVAEGKMAELAKELEKKAQEEIDKDLNKETPAEEITKRVEEVMKQAELLGPQKTEELLAELAKSDLGNTFLRQRHKDVEESIKLARAGDKAALSGAQERLKLAEKMPLSAEQKKAVTGLNLTIDRAINGQTLAGGWGTFFADGANSAAHYFSGQTALPEIPTNPPSAKNSGSGAGGGSSGGGGGSATSFSNNSSSSPASTPSHSQDSDQGSSPSTSTETNSSGSGATSSKPSAATPPSSSSGGGVASAVTPSATPTPSPAPAPAGQSSSPLANNAVSGSGAGRGTSPATQPHGAPISKNPSAENGETKSAKKPTGSNSDSDVGSILGRVPLGASAMPQTVAAGSVPRMRRENSAGTTTAEPLATAGGEPQPRSAEKPSEQDSSVRSPKLYIVGKGREASTGEGLIKNTGQPTSPVKIAYNGDSSASGDNNQSSPVTSTSNQGKPSYNWRENGRELQPLATNDLNTNELRVPPLEATGLAVNSLNTNDNPAPNTAGEKSQNSQNNSIVGQQEKLALYTKGLAQDALMVAALGSPSPRGNPKTTTGGLTQFAASNTNTVITMPPITKDTAARGLAAKTKPAPKKTGVAAQAPKRSIAGGTPKDKDKVLLRVRGFREIRGLLGAR